MDTKKSEISNILFHYVPFLPQNTKHTPVFLWASHERVNASIRLDIDGLNGEEGLQERWRHWYLR